MNRLWIIALTVSVLLLGCAGQPGRVELYYGASLGAIKTQQIYQIDKTRASIKGIDGQAAGIIMDKYRRGFKEQEPPTFVIPVGKQ